MRTIIAKLTFGNPRHALRPAVWTFFEDFMSLVPALLIYLVINTLAVSFTDPQKLDLQLLLYISVVLFIMAVVQFAVGLRAYQNRFLPTAQHIAENRISFVKKLRRLPLGFFSKKESGELINNFVTDFINIQQALTGYLSGIFSVIISCILTFVFMFIYNPLLAAAFYIAIPLTTVLLVLSMKVIERHSRVVAAARDKAATELNEYLRGMRTLKSYNQTGEGFDKLKNAYRNLMDCCIREESAGGSLMRLCTSLVQVGLPLLCMAGAYLLLGGSFTIVEFISIMIIGTKILSPVVMVVSNMMMIRANYLSAKRLDEVMKQPEMQGEKAVLAAAAIQFDRVTFAYDEGSEPVLRDVSFTIPKDQLTAIVGPSGSGKTTILRLLARFWDPGSGSIRCGDRLTDISAESWQEQISMVLQEVYLFNETIRENIMFGRKDATEEEMIAAAQAAGCHDFIMALPDAYDTVVGEGGSTLSGGEKQRISIARAILKKAPVLLLDEPTASLDARNEALVQQGIQELVSDTTVVMIAHRLKTVKNADQILVVDEGQIKERGTHEELLKRQGIYARLWQMQERSREWKL